jgi:serine/threonine protein kinase
VLSHGIDTSKSIGYTKAIDMWSLGVLTTIVLIGSNIFQAMPIVGLNDMSIIYHLSALDTSPRTTNCPEAKDFIRRLLRLDEKTRMTAHQAMDHQWFIGRLCSETLGMAYQRAMANWQPKHANGNILEYVEVDIDLRFKERSLESSLSLPSEVHPEIPLDMDSFSLSENHVTVDLNVEIEQKKTNPVNTVRGFADSFIGDGFDTENLPPLTKKF